MITRLLLRVWFWLAHHIFFRERRHARYIVLMGPPGSGKGTIAKLLCPELGLPHISVGSLLRLEVADKTEIGRQVASIVENGRLVPEPITQSLLARELSQPGYYRGAIIDGFPRSVLQARMFDRLLGRWGNQVERVVLLQAA